MDVAFRVSIRKLLVVSLVVFALCAGFVARGVSESSSSGSRSGDPVPTKKFSASDLLLAAASAQGIHMRFGGVTTTTGSDHTNDIQLSDFSFSADLPVQAQTGGRTLGKVAVAEIAVSHSTDKYSLPLLDKLLQPAASQPATLFFTNLSGPGGAAFDYLQINLTGTYVSKFDQAGGDETPFETIRFNFAAMTFTYRVPGGATTNVSYNLITGQ